MTAKTLRMGMAAVALASMTWPALGAEYFVSAGGDNTTYTNWATAAHTIQAAVNAASGGDTVWVTNGTYTGSGSEVVLLTTNITLKSVNGYAVTIINGQAARRGINMSGTVSNGLVEGFTITNCSSTYGAGLYIQCGTVQNCRIVNNATTGGTPGGGAYLNERQAYLRNSIVAYNSAASGAGGGVVVCRGAVVENCLIRNNSNSGGWSGGGVQMTDDTYGQASTLRNCTVVANTSSGADMGSGIGCRSGSWGGGKVQNCIVWNNTGGSRDVVNTSSNLLIEYCSIGTISYGYGGGSNNITSDPLFLNTAVYDYHPRFGSPCINAGMTIATVTNDIDGNARPFPGTAYDMGSYEYSHAPTTLYVATNGSHTTPFTNWTTAATNIQSAVDAAYFAGGDTVMVTNGTYTGTGSQVVQLDKNISLRSVNGYAVTIIDGKAARKVILMSGTANNGLVDGFTITNGYDSVGYAAGVYIQYGTVQNCLIIKNTATGGGWGGGACVMWQQSYLRNSILAYNSNPGGLGGGVAVTRGGVVENCLIRNNSNSGGWSGGGVIVIDDAYGNLSVLRNCTVVANTSVGADMGSGIGCRDGYGGGKVQNCIVWNNTGGAKDVVNTSSNMLIEYCSIGTISYGYGGGANNITNTPIFVNASANDYHLQAGSPCIDTGETIAAITNDLDGNFRPRRGKVGGAALYDMGAYEAFPPKSCVMYFR